VLPLLPGQLKAQEKPLFGTLDQGGMPCGLIELSSMKKSSGWILNANVPYTIWAAPKAKGIQFNASSWRPFGPHTFASQKRYFFNWDGASHGGRLATNPEITLTTPVLSPAYASLHVQNFDGINVWVISNPLPPGCGGATQTHVSKSGRSVQPRPVGLLPGSLSGTWTAYQPAKNWSHGGMHIIQNGNALTYVIFSGERHTGRVLSANTVSYLQANATGTVSKNGNRIDWSTGGYWTKDGN
jgi:hypothetical protein